MPHVLIVKADASRHAPTVTAVEQCGFSTSIARSLAEARRELTVRAADVLLADATLPDGGGLDLLVALDRRAPAHVVLLTDDPAFAEALRRTGATRVHCLLKPLEPEVLQAALVGAAQSIAAFELGGATETERFGLMLGNCTAMREVYGMIAKVAPTDVTVLISGESGTGKELVARTIHQRSGRQHERFLALNCGAIPETLIESELFGHEKGAFTGADRAHPGVFEQAHGGVLFLDEITEMAPEVQVKLLRVLEEGTLMRVGGTAERRVDVRVIAATNRDPQAAIAEGRLREDLYYRLAVLPIHLPPLRERGPDVLLLARHFLAQANKAADRPKRLRPEAEDRLRAYHWPGNVRQLANIIRRAHILEGEDITLDVLDGLMEEPAPRRDAGDNGQDGDLQFDIGTSISDAEKELILTTLEHYDGDKQKTARVLGVSVRTLYNRLKDYELERP